MSWELAARQKRQLPNGLLWLAVFMAATLIQATPAKADEAPARVLHAGVAKSEAMSRAELLDRASEISLAPPAQPNFSAMQSAQPAPAEFNLQQSTTPLESDLAADVQAREYNVDWSSWLAKVADRWYFMLQQCEHATGSSFVTQRPALIQFTCYANGAIANVMLKQSSGCPVYDRLQMVALMQSMPVPPFPYGTHRQTITLVQGWESHYRRPGESDYIPGSFGKGFPLEKVKEWVRLR